MTANCCHLSVQLITHIFNLLLSSHSFAYQRREGRSTLHQLLPLETGRTGNMEFNEQNEDGEQEKASERKKDTEYSAQLHLLPLFYPFSLRK